MIRITYVLPSGAQREVEAGRGSNLRVVALRAGVPLYAPLERVVNCRGNGLCGTCRVEVLEGEGNLSAPSAMERLKLGRLVGAGLRLACQARVHGAVKVAVQPDVRARARQAGAQRASSV